MEKMSSYFIATSKEAAQKWGSVQKFRIQNVTPAILAKLFDILYLALRSIEIRRKSQFADILMFVPPNFYGSQTLKY